MTGWPSWVPEHHDSTLIAVLAGREGQQWAIVQGEYETGFRKIVPTHTALSDRGEEHIINFWSSEQPTVEHFRKLMEMGFPSAGIGIPFLGNWTCERLDAVFDAYKNGADHAQAA